MTKAKTMYRYPLLLLAVLLGPAACAHGERPAAEVPVAAQTGPPVASYEIPEQGSKGRLHVVSLGIEALPVGPDGAGAPFLHLRLAALNGSDNAIWFLDPTEQLLTAAGVKVAPAFAEASVGGPVLELERGKRGHLDLYYPAPTDGAATVALSWRLARGSVGAVVVGSTELRRVDHDNRRYAYYQPADEVNVIADRGPGAWWWNDYYFWNDGGCWWGYRRAHFHSHYPWYERPPYYAGGGGGGGGGGAPAVSNPDRGGLSPERETSFWRETPRETSPPAQREQQPEHQQLAQPGAAGEPRQRLVRQQQLALAVSLAVSLAPSGAVPAAFQRRQEQLARRRWAVTPPPAGRFG